MVLVLVAVIDYVGDCQVGRGSGPASLTAIAPARTRDVEADSPKLPLPALLTVRALHR